MKLRNETRIITKKNNDNDIIIILPLKFETISSKDPIASQYGFCTSHIALLLFKANIRMDIKVNMTSQAFEEETSPRPPFRTREPIAIVQVNDQGKITFQNKFGSTFFLLYREAKLAYPS